MVLEQGHLAALFLDTLPAMIACSVHDANYGFIPRPIFKKFQIALKQNLQEDNLSTKDNWQLARLQCVLCLEVLLYF